jgi:hypothetical protein
MLIFMDKTLEGQILAWVVFAYLILNLVIFLLCGQADPLGLYSGLD